MVSKVQRSITKKKKVQTSTAYTDGVLLQLLCNGSDLLHPVLVSGQVALERLVFPHQGSDLHERGSFVVLLGQQVLLT